MTRPGFCLISDLTFRDQCVASIVWDTGLERVAVRFTETERRREGIAVGRVASWWVARAETYGREGAGILTVCVIPGLALCTLHSWFSVPLRGHTGCHHLPLPSHFSWSGFSRMIVDGHRALGAPAFCGADLAVAARRRIGISFRRVAFLGSASSRNP